ncbi:unnamed protein product [Caenorhabditis bovis]|uniref:Neuropeptide-Like Protein n=1 Tax=Caenorhabditis bovis TaxID=2654633 RepID=A0A8S1EUC9_9PELO|nr:unnamed protein product [Caenorhabditis bovis]
MWYFTFILAIIPTIYSHNDYVLLVRVPDGVSDGMLVNSYQEKEVFTKRAIPFNGGMYGKRAAIPFSGGMYGKRSDPLFIQQRSVIPFSGGMYGKRSLSSLNGYAQNENQIKRGAMPFSGGMYGKRK